MQYITIFLIAKVLFDIQFLKESQTGNSIFTFYPLFHSKAMLKQAVDIQPLKSLS
jgi:hypothetical protein